MQHPPRHIDHFQPLCAKLEPFLLLPSAGDDGSIEFVARWIRKDGNKASLSVSAGFFLPADPVVMLASNK